MFSKVHFSFDKLLEIVQKTTKRGIILADEKIGHSIGPKIQKLLDFELIFIQADEKHKTRENKAHIEDQLLQKGYGKDTLIVALGGGITTDLVAFIASTYMRGVSLILIPTTLLAMVDAAIGGKTGVNTPFGKNTIGTFYQPDAVFINPDFLKSLPEKEMQNGLSEILKMGLVASPKIWEMCHGYKKHLPTLIKESVASKCEIVEADFQEKKGLRHILNFGHTVGHALELLSNFTMPHGEAVAFGCMAESYLSFMLGYLSQNTLEEILLLYRNLGYVFKKMDSAKFTAALKLDKKAQANSPRFVLIEEIGKPLSFDGAYCKTVEKNVIEKLIQWMQEYGKS